MTNPESPDNKYRKKPAEIEAFQWTAGPDQTDYPEWIIEAMQDGDVVIVSDPLQMQIQTLEGLMVANVDDWIIRGVKGEIYPCKPDIFEMTYEKASAESPGYAALIDEAHMLMALMPDPRPRGTVQSLVDALRALLKERDELEETVSKMNGGRSCGICGNDYFLAEIGERLGFRPDVMVKEIQSLQSKLEQYDKALEIIESVNGLSGIEATADDLRDVARNELERIRKL